jgi:hypothetical protein
LVASRRSGSAVKGGLLGSLGAADSSGAAGAGSSQVEQKMLRSASAMPDLPGPRATGWVMSGARATGRLAGLSLSARAVASIMWETALAANAEHRITATTPTTQKYFFM